MPLKIWNIGKANSRIEELEAQNATLIKERDEARTALESNSAEISTGAEQLSADLATAKQTIKSTAEANAKLTEQVAAKDAEIATLKAEVSKLPQKVEVQVASQLATQQAALGQPPIPAPQTKDANGKPTTELKGIARVRAGIKAELDKTFPIKRQ